MAFATKFKLGRPGPSAYRVSSSESGQIAQVNPGPGLPLSRLSPEVQRKLRQGLSIAVQDIEIDLQNIQAADPAGQAER
jgi:hypothetical protein